MTDPSGNPYPLNNKDMYGRPRADPNWEYQPTDRTGRRSGAAPTTAPYPETRDDYRRRDPQASSMPRGRDSRDDYTEPEPRSHSRRPRDGRRGQIEDDKITHTGARESSRNRRRDRSSHRNEIDTSRREPARTGAGTRPEGRRDHSRRPAGESAPRSGSQIRERSTTGERRLVTTGTTRDGRGREDRDRDSRERRDHHGSRTRRPMTEREREEAEGDRRDERRRRRRQDENRRPRRDSSRDKGRSSRESRRSDGRRGSGEQKSSDPSLRSMAKGAARGTLNFLKSL